MKRVAWLLLGLFVPALAWCAEAPLEASMVVNGTITVNPDGSVQGYTVHDLGELPPPVRQIVQATVPRWQFVPIVIDGRPTAAEAGMSLRIVADWHSVHAKQATIRVAGAAFGCEARAKSQLPGECPQGTTVAMESRVPPRYPIQALRARVGGEVFLVLEIGRDGHVTQAAARQVNLYSLTDQSAHFRKVLADASIEAARRWTFRIPTVGANADKRHWVVTVPINYMIAPSPMQTGSLLRRTSKPVPGQWRAYVPGPVQSIPWDDEDESGVNGSGDAIAGGELFVRDERFVLKTPLNGDSQS